MNNVETYIAKRQLAIAYLNGGESALRLFVQLLGYAPCPKCGYVKNHCRCKRKMLT